MKLQCEQDTQEQVGMILRASVAAGIGEWQVEPGQRQFEPLQRPEPSESAEPAHEAEPEK